MHQFQESIRPKEGIPAGRQSNWQRWRQAWENRRQGSVYVGGPARSLGVTRITVELSGTNGNAAGAPGNHSYNLLFNDC
jgi:hypothetical protein